MRAAGDAAARAAQVHRALAHHRRHHHCTRPYSFTQLSDSFTQLPRQLHSIVEGRSTVIKFDDLKEDGEGACLTESVYNVVFLKSIPDQFH